MSISTVNISFQDDFLGQIDQFAKNESRSRSEFVREAVRLYIDRKREFDNLFKIGQQIGSTLDITEEDVMPEIKKHRKAKQKIK